MKPELTFRRSLRLISKRWWLLLLGGVLFAALAFLVVGQKKAHYVASADLGINDVTAVPLGWRPGYGLVSNNPKYYGDWSPDDFVNPVAAAAASKQPRGLADRRPARGEAYDDATHDQQRAARLRRRLQPRRAPSLSSRPTPRRS